MYILIYSYIIYVPKYISKLEVIWILVAGHDNNCSYCILSKDIFFRNIYANIFSHFMWGGTDKVNSFKMNHTVNLTL